MRKELAFLLASFLLIGCASREIASTDGKRTISIAVTANRRLELEPCGCSMKDLGGIYREANIYSRFSNERRAADLNVSAGVTFAPQGSSFRSENLAHYRRKADYLVRSMNALGVQAISPSGEDFVLGAEFLEALSQTAKFQFISSNLYKKATQTPLFKPLLTMEIHKVPVVVLGLSDPAAMPHTEKEIETRPPEKVLKELLPKYDDGKNLIVILTSLSLTEQSKLSALFKHPVIWLGGNEKEEFTGVSQTSGRYIAVNPTSRGREVNFLTIEVPQVFDRLYSDRLAEHETGQRAQFEFLLNTLKSLPASKRASVAKQMASAREVLHKTPVFAVAPDAKTSIYSYEIVDVGQMYDGSNAVSAIVDDFKKTVREAAMAH
jgi:2',3'-cyclic-nucleotide 2'-phosphodiesterase (5'-nucleotidase family)